LCKYFCWKFSLKKVNKNSPATLPALFSANQGYKIILAATQFFVTFAPSKQTYTK